MANQDDSQASESVSATGQIEIARLIVEHHEAVYRYAYRIAGNSADAEDLSQQTFLVAQQRLHQIREPEKARAWLYAVLRSVYLKGRRKQIPAPAANLELEIDTFAAPEIPSQGFDSERLQAAIGGLPDEFRLVVLMFYFEDCSYKEIAEQLEIPLGTIMSRLSRAKARLRELLADEDHPQKNSGQSTSIPPASAGLTAGNGTAHSAELKKVAAFESPNRHERP